MMSSKTFRNQLVCAFFVSCCALFSYGQENGSKEFLKTAVYGNGGTTLFYFGATIYGERELWSKNKSWGVERHGQTEMEYGRIAQTARIGFGGNVNWDGDIARYLLLETGFVFGPNKHHFETSFGAGYFFGDADFSPILPTGSLGYRRQLPDNNLIIRAGVGFPDGVYFGFGLCF